MIKTQISPVNIFQNHKIEEVRIWAQSEVNSCEYMVAYEGNREKEKI